MHVYPWLIPPLDKWDIVGMNHYYKKNERHLFIAMVKDEKCIKAEGKEAFYVFKELREKAENINKE